MKAQNLTISLPNAGCNKNCPYCISRMTPSIRTDFNLMVRNIKKVKTLAKSSGVCSVLLTSKGEPFMDFNALLKFAIEFDEFPLEVQTNGIALVDKGKSWIDGTLRQLYLAGVNTIAFSIDCFAFLHGKLRYLIHKIHTRGMNVRICYNVTEKMSRCSIDQILEASRSLKVEQVLFRKISYPESAKDTKEARWIRRYAPAYLYSEFYNDAIELFENPPVVRFTTDGTPIYDIWGTSVVFSDYCVQEVNMTSDIRSLIFQEDGHLYTSWNSKASILF